MAADVSRDGRVTHRMEVPQTMTAWDRVFHLLKAALPEALYHRGKELRRIAQGAQGVTAHFADGSVAEGDSGRRRRHPLDRAPAISARAEPALCRLHGMARAGGGIRVPAPLHAQLFERFSFGPPPNEQMLGYPVAGPDNDLRAGHRRYNFVWYRPASEERELPRLLTDEGAAAPTRSRSRCRRSRATSWRGCATEGASRCSRRRSTRCCRFARSRSCSRSTISKCRAWRSAGSRSLGDAAFVARPHVGAGVAKAAGGCAGARRRARGET